MLLQCMQSGQQVGIPRCRHQVWAALDSLCITVACVMSMQVSGSGAATCQLGQHKKYAAPTCASDSPYVLMLSVPHSTRAMVSGYLPPFWSRSRSSSLEGNSNSNGYSRQSVLGHHLLHQHLSISRCERMCLLCKSTCVSRVTPLP
jgi:hypothetical protein